MYDLSCYISSLLLDFKLGTCFVPKLLYFRIVFNSFCFLPIKTYTILNFEVKYHTTKIPLKD